MILIILVVAGGALVEPDRPQIRDDESVAYNDTIFRARCHRDVLKVQYRNVPSAYPAAKIKEVSVNGRRVKDGIELLSLISAGRFISKIGVRSCGGDPEVRKFLAYLEYGPSGTLPGGLAPLTFVQIFSSDGKRWSVRKE